MLHTEWVSDSIALCANMENKQAVFQSYLPIHCIISQNVGDGEFKQAVVAKLQVSSSSMKSNPLCTCKKHSCLVAEQHLCQWREVGSTGFVITVCLFHHCMLS